MPGDSETVPVFVIVVPSAAVTVAVIVSVAFCPLEITPIVQIPVELLYEPSEEDAESKVTPEGNVSDATTPNEFDGPPSRHGQRVVDDSHPLPGSRYPPSSR